MLSEAATWQLAHEVVVAWDGPMADIDKTESTVTNAVVSLAGELAEHLLTPADVDDFAGRTLGHLATVGATGKGFTKDFTGKRTFVWIKKKLSPEQMQAVHDLSLIHI